MKDGRAISTSAIIVERRQSPIHKGYDLVATASDGVEYVLWERVGERALPTWLENLHKASNKGFAHAIEISATHALTGGDSVTFR